MSSSKSTHRNTNGLKAHAEEKARLARERVVKAMTMMVEEGQAVNFNTVAKRAEVTKSYLYVQPDLRARIEAARRQQGAIRRNIPRETERSDKSKDILLQAKERRIRELEEENRRLKDQLKVVMGKQYAQM